MRVAIAGAGNVGLHVANALRRAGHDVLIIEQRQAVVDRATVEAGVEWFVGDSCEVSSLREARLDRCEVLVAATGDDEDNLVTSLLAKQEFAIPRVIARVNHPKNEWMFDERWGVDVAVSTPRMLSALVEEAVTTGDLVELMSLRKGSASAKKAEKAKFKVMDVPAAAKWADVIMMTMPDTEQKATYD